MQELLKKLISHLLAMKICYHNSHHIVSRVSFFSDHEAFGGFYSEVDTDYDDTVERSIGLYDMNMANLQVIMALASPKLAACPSIKAPDNATLFSYGLQLEGELINLVEMICKSPECRESTKQLISEIGNKAEKRVYKLKQRTRK